MATFIEHFKRLQDDDIPPAWAAAMALITLAVERGTPVPTDRTNLPLPDYRMVMPTTECRRGLRPPYDWIAS